MVEIASIIVAGGSGSRMGSKLPKQFLPIAGEPILMHTIRAFYDALGEHQIIVVLPSDHITIWSELCRRHSFGVEHHIVTGGKNRFYSVKNGLACVDKDVDVVLVQDGVRPFVTERLIDDMITAARLNGAAVPYMAQVDSLREICDEDRSVIVDRNRYVRIQTPQAFDKKIIQEAYLQPYSSTFTDDASVVESMGVEINLVAGDERNIKITSPLDMVVAEAILKNYYI